MYKYLIISIAIMSIGGAGYYINKAGGGELIGNAITGETKINTIPPTLETVAGLYICDNSSGCENKYVLLLKDNQTAEMLLISPKNGIDEIETEKKLDTDTIDTPIERNSIIVNDTTNQSISNPSAIEATEATTSTLLAPENSSTTDTNIVEATESEERFTPEENDHDIDDMIALKVTDTHPDFFTEKGEWSIGVQNMLVVTFFGLGTTTYEIPQKFVIKNVGASTLSKISYTKSNYKDMVSPVFIKQE